MHSTPNLTNMCDDRPKLKNPNGTCPMNCFSFWKRWKKSRSNHHQLLPLREYSHYVSSSSILWLILHPQCSPPRAVTAPGFTPVTGATQGGTVVNPLGGASLLSTPTSQPNQQQNGSSSLALGAHTGALPLAANSVLPARPTLPDDPVIPHNGFMTVEEGEKAFVHLLRKAGVDANWTWDQTMRAIITDPLYKALNTLAEKKACWEKVRLHFFYTWRL